MLIKIPLITIATGATYPLRVVVRRRRQRPFRRDCASTSGKLPKREIPKREIPKREIIERKLQTIDSRFPKKLGDSPRVFSSTGTFYPFAINDDQTEIHFTLNQNQDPLLDKDQDPERLSLIRKVLPNPSCCWQKVPSRC